MSDHQQVARAVSVVRPLVGGSVGAAIILGTGLGGLADHIESAITIPYGDIPGFPCSTALSHRGRLVCGQLAGVNIVAMQGRCHRYEGYDSKQLGLPVHVLGQLGARLLIVSNAAGGINPLLRDGDLVVIQDHIDLMWDRPPSSTAGGGRSALVRPVRPASPYSPALIEHALSVARRERIVLHRGVYVAVSGPCYETRAEYRMFRAIGGDVVGMSTVPEVNAAAERGMPVLALSMVTNVARPDNPRRVSADEVVDVAERCEPSMRKIVLDLLHSLPGLP